MVHYPSWCPELGELSAGVLFLIGSGREPGMTLFKLVRLGRGKWVGHCLVMPVYARENHALRKVVVVGDIWGEFYIPRSTLVVPLTLRSYEEIHTDKDTKEEIVNGDPTQPG